MNHAPCGVTPLDPEMVQVGDAVGHGRSGAACFTVRCGPVGVVEVLVLAHLDHQVPLVADPGPVQQFSPAAARAFVATGADIADLGEEHGHRVLRVCDKGTKVVLIPLPPAVGRAIDHAIGTRTRGPILLNGRGARWRWMCRRPASRPRDHGRGYAR